MGKKYCITCGAEIPEMSQICPSCGTVVGKKSEESAEEKKYRMFREQQEYFYNQQKEQMENIQRQNEELKRQMQQMNQPQKKIRINALSLVAAVLILIGLFLPFMSEGKEVEDLAGYERLGIPKRYSSLAQSEGTIFQWIDLMDDSNNSSYGLIADNKSEFDTGKFIVAFLLGVLIIVLVVDTFKSINVLKGVFTTIGLGLIIVLAISFNDEAKEDFNMTLSCAMGFYTMMIAMVLAFLSFFVGRKKQ